MSSRCTLMAMSNCSQADWLVWTRSDFAYQREDRPVRRSRMFSLLMHLTRFWNLFVDLPVAKIDLSKVNFWQSPFIGRWPKFSAQQIFLGFSDSSYPGKNSGTILAVLAEIFVILSVAKGDFPKVKTGRVPPMASHASHGMAESRSPWVFLIRPSLNISRCTLMAMVSCRHSQKWKLVQMCSDFLDHRDERPARRSRMFSLLADLLLAVLAESFVRVLASCKTSPSIGKSWNAGG